MRICLRQRSHTRLLRYLLSTMHSLVFARFDNQFKARGLCGFDYDRFVTKAAARLLHQCQVIVFEVN